MLLVVGCMRPHADAVLRATPAAAPVSIPSVTPPAESPPPPALPPLPVAQLPTTFSKTDGPLWKSVNASTVTVYGERIVMVNPAGEVFAVDPSDGVEAGWGTLPQHAAHLSKQSMQTLGGFEAVGGLIAQHQPSATVFYDPRTLKPRFQLDVPAEGYHHDLLACEAGLLVLDKPGLQFTVGPRLSLIDPHDGRTIWTASVSNRTELVVARDLVVLHDGERLVAWRLSDGTEKWALSTPGGRLHVSGPLLAIQRGGEVEFVDLGTGTPRAKKIRIDLPIVDVTIQGSRRRTGSPVASAVVGDDAVYVSSQDLTSMDGRGVLKAFDFGGQLLWEAQLPTSYPASMANLLLAGGRVFVAGQTPNRGAVLSGFDVATGKKDFEWWMEWPVLFSVLRGGEGELVVARSFACGTLAFDPSQSIELHPVRASGKIVHAAGSLSWGELSRAWVCLGQKCTPARPSGAYAIELETRGQVPLYLAPGEFLSGRTLPPPPSPDMSPCAEDVVHRLDFEAQTHFVRDLPLRVKYCPNFEY